MPEPLMSREDALEKLLRVEPETRDRLILITGWPLDETIAVLDSLVKQKRVGYGVGPYNCAGRRPYIAREVRR